MGSTVLNMSMSLDGFVAGPNETRRNGLGDDGMRLHEWLFPQGTGDHPDDIAGLTGVNGAVMDEVMATGSVVTGRRTFEMADNWHGDHHNGVQVYVYTQRDPDPDAAQWPNVHYERDIAVAFAKATEAAGDKEVLVHGIGTARDALAAGVLDEIEVHVVPVLLGQGRRLFEERDAAHIELYRTRVLEGEAGVTHLRFRVLRMKG